MNTYEVTYDEGFGSITQMVVIPGDPTDVAVRHALKMQHHVNTEGVNFEVLEIEPFDPDSVMREALINIVIAGVCITAAQLLINHFVVKPLARKNPILMFPAHKRFMRSQGIEFHKPNGRFSVAVPLTKES